MVGLGVDELVERFEEVVRWDCGVRPEEGVVLCG